jgi:hypothetical protein
MPPHSKLASAPPAMRSTATSASPSLIHTRDEKLHSRQKGRESRLCTYLAAICSAVSPSASCFPTRTRFGLAPDRTEGRQAGREDRQTGPQGPPAARLSLFCSALCVYVCVYVCVYMLLCGMCRGRIATVPGNVRTDPTRQGTHRASTAASPSPFGSLTLQTAALCSLIIVWRW